MTEEFTISTDKSRLDVDVIEGYLSRHSYWAKGRSRRTIVRAIEHSLCFGIYNELGQQVAFARVVSDFAVFAWIMDVFVLENYRKKGLGKLLMKEITNHPDLQSLQRWGLVTQDAHGLYEQFGFRRLAKPETMMEVVNAPS